MNQLPREKRIQLLKLLVEGMSLYATSRMTGVSINTVTKLLVDIGRACAEYQDKALVSLPCHRIQCDEIWSFCDLGEKGISFGKAEEWGYGDVWTWRAICADTNLVVDWMIGVRDVRAAKAFVDNLKPRLRFPAQLTIGGNTTCLCVMDKIIGEGVDSVTSIKTCDIPAGGYNQRSAIHFSNRFRKKVGVHACAVALHFMHYNFARVQEPLYVTPAMKAGVASDVWSLSEICALIEIDST